MTDAPPTEIHIWQLILRSCWQLTSWPDEGNLSHFLTGNVFPEHFPQIITPTEYTFTIEMLYNTFKTA